MQEIKRFISPGGTRIVRLCRKDDGRFFFEEQYQATEDLRHLGFGVEQYWSSGFESGTYDDIGAAERDLRAVTPWLRDADQSEDDSL